MLLRGPGALRHRALRLERVTLSGLKGGLAVRRSLADRLDLPLLSFPGDWRARILSFPSLSFSLSPSSLVLSVVSSPSSPSLLSAQDNSCTLSVPLVQGNFSLR